MWNLLCEWGEEYLFAKVAGIDIFVVALLCGVREIFKNGSADDPRELREDKFLHNTFAVWVVKQEASIHLSNLNPLDPKTGKATRVGRKETENANGKKVLVRYAKKSGEEIK